MFAEKIRNTDLLSGTPFDLHPDGQIFVTVRANPKT